MTQSLCFAGGATGNRDRSLQNFPPISSTVASPVMMRPAFTSMSPLIRAYVCGLPKILTTGEITLPITLPRPVVNSTRCEPQEMRSRIPSESFGLL